MALYKVKPREHDAVEVTTTQQRDALDPALEAEVGDWILDVNGFPIAVKPADFAKDWELV